MFLLTEGGTTGQCATLKGVTWNYGSKWLYGCVVPVLTTDNIEKTHPWTSCGIWKYTDTGDRKTDRGHRHNTEEDDLQTKTGLMKENTQQRNRLSYT